MAWNAREFSQTLPQLKYSNFDRLFFKTAQRLIIFSDAIKWLA
jgi:hypothetical protein